ncbi:MAG: hypothetical protein AAF984_09650 [Verrucomicrobiota bacterium]
MTTVLERLTAQAKVAAQESDKKEANELAAKKQKNQDSAISELRQCIEQVLPAELIEELNLKYGYSNRNRVNRAYASVAITEEHALTLSLSNGMLMVSFPENMFIHSGSTTHPIWPETSSDIAEKIGSVNTFLLLLDQVKQNIQEAEQKEQVRQLQIKKNYEAAERKRIERDQFITEVKTELDAQDAVLRPMIEKLANDFDWEWPSGVTVTVYKWEWAEGWNDDEGEPYRKYVYALVDTLDEEGYFTDVNGREIKLEPYNYPTVERIVVDSKKKALDIAPYMAKKLRIENVRQVAVADTEGLKFTMNEDMRVAHIAKTLPVPAPWLSDAAKIHLPESQVIQLETDLPVIIDKLRQAKFI